MKIQNTYENVISLHKEGYNNSQIAKKLNLYRGTVRKWLKIDPLTPKIRYSKNLIDLSLEIDDIKGVYSYILGLYFGDGYINKTERSFRLRIAMDRKYDNLNAYVVDRLNILFPNNSVSIVNTKDGCIHFSVYNNQLSKLFPHLGKGKKHERVITLTDWQLKIIDWVELMKGLFHSDGTYYCSRNKYFFFEFKNKSKDLLNIFKLCCEKNNIEYTFGDDVIRIYKKKFVDIMKILIGTKTEIVY